MKPSRWQLTIPRQGVKLIPRNLAPWSHVVPLLFTQLSHALSLNNVCDAMRNHSGSVATLRGAAPLSRDGISHANRVRNADMAEELFWETLASLQSMRPKVERDSFG